MNVCLYSYSCKLHYAEIYHEMWYVNEFVFIQWPKLIHTNSLQPQPAHITNTQVSLTHWRSPTNMSPQQIYEMGSMWHQILTRHLYYIIAFPSNTFDLQQDVLSALEQVLWWQDNIVSILIYVTSAIYWHMIAISTMLGQTSAVCYTNTGKRVHISVCSQTVFEVQPCNVPTSILCIFICGDT